MNENMYEKVSYEYLQDYFDICKVSCNHLYNELQEEIFGYINIRVNYDRLEVKIIKRQRDSDVIDFDFFWSEDNFYENISRNSYYIDEKKIEILEDYRKAILKKYFK